MERLGEVMGGEGRGGEAVLFTSRHVVTVAPPLLVPRLAILRAPCHACHAPPSADGIRKPMEPQNVRSECQCLHEAIYCAFSHWGRRCWNQKVGGAQQTIGVGVARHGTTEDPCPPASPWHETWHHHGEGQPEQLATRLAFSETHAIKQLHVTWTVCGEAVSGSGRVC
ncbi:hypothetical protein O3P69_015800 [Scylla paramamosain]|uniref:Uncharacterized protein n=1 Tax=Scylla paramamosain TaxID=85552 RepID=A0AAW0T7M0_SCYPA